MANITREEKANGVRYRANVRVQGPDGRQIRKTQRFRTRREAERWASRIEVEIRAGLTNDDQLRWATLIEAYLDHPEGLARIKGESERRNRGRNLGWWLDRVGRLKVAATSPAHLDRALAELRQRGPSGRPASAATANRYLSHLSAVYRWAERRHGLSRAGNPAIGLRAREAGGSDRWLSDDERAILLEEVAGDPDLELLVRLGLTTGHRRGRLVDLQWSQIDRAEKLIYLGETKNGQPLIVPLEPSVERLLADRVRRVDTDYILSPTARSGIPRFPEGRWQKLRERCYARGVAPFRFHDLRHSTASYLAQAGWSLPQIGEFLGHTSPQSTARYAHLVRRSVVEAAREALRARGVDD